MASDFLEPSSDFYFWAASNASTDTFPDNKPQKFRNKFAQSLNLGDGWEIALCEIYYPNNYHFNLEKLKEAAKFTLLYKTKTPQTIRKSFTVGPAAYTSDENIALAINTAIIANIGQNQTPAVLAKSKTVTGRWELTTGTEDCEIFMDNESAQALFWQLGFGQLKYYPGGYELDIPIGAKQQPVFPPDKYAATVLFFDSDKTFQHEVKLPEDLSAEDKVVNSGPHLVGQKSALRFGFASAIDKRIFFASQFLDSTVRFADEKSGTVFKSLGFSGYNCGPGLFTWNKLPIVAADPVLSIAQRPALFIYCDKIEYQLVGDTRAPLLLTVPVETPWDRPVVWFAFQRLTYVPVRKGYINDIEVAITDDQGNPVLFKGGKVFLKLHFRKQK